MVEMAGARSLGERSEEGGGSLEGVKRMLSSCLYVQKVVGKCV